MRGLSFALLLLSINLMVGIIGTIHTEIGLTSMGNTTLSDHIEEEEILNTMNTSVSGISFVDSVFNTADVVGKAVNLLLKFIYNTTIGIPQMLLSSPFNVPPLIVYGLIVPLQLIMCAIMLAEFLRGSSIEV